MNIFPEISGEVLNWDIIVMGHLKVNTYFGESYDKPPRGDPSTCTSVMIRGKDFDGSPYILLIDPTLRLTAEDYYFDINRRTGLSGMEVTHCFCTHQHADHVMALEYFPRAKYLAAKPVAQILNEGASQRKFLGVEGEFLKGVYAVPLPGHTPGIHGAAFLHAGKKILVAGDAVMSKYHFEAGTTDFQNDPEYIKKAAETIQNMKESFDIVVPGHDNLIVI